MTKDSYTYYSEKGPKFLKKARLFYGLFIAIFVAFIVQMFIYQIHSYFVNLLIIVIIMFFLYKIVFFEYIYIIRKQTVMKRIELMKVFSVNDEVVEYFSGEVYKKLYDENFDILHKNDVYVLAKYILEDSINDIGLAVYFLDNTTDEVKPSVREISNELTGYVANSSVIKVILLVRDTFSKEEVESLKYDSAVHNNTVVIGLERSTSKLTYNYFLNGKEVDEFLSEFFQVDLNKKINEEE